ncbi:hypothetical protein A3D42_02465 [Candidatus Nomurabacteria bacterium RIFCSPHIGHO2_02_FULL_41_18]|uniref:DUF4367 domain-containing protein n=1 Tax=Candidatus Nomurabacteria bacterium RIFCSPHIGHO2_02_FULL_41_18 TaxID=1801754 RepID=A0A1F6W553_9BACT|nr:MAG: hypothetical protein A2737_02050 [Candidatus Nomurabacteria bacterium RIFCSPHIGHO2_01_FULL_41_71]OGI76974.1 MAG: hypothetical protein A3D42_02465 [Candidatus Nomurabacteria bacterium RIFCSPHIGHO2_02_FULL_41_18]OGI89484.1 MAG: hypothetical protein A3B01_01170 [Candidatus Nomurabacteria bacterium RIFCSPLOWO2_01_FULL_41_52b]OGJ00067.1 MAG: hypothetical protein A3I90_02880 [Candidatus Nomurabacteria bacterium RIFCSPLOWO2_02_FULL_41_9]
MEKDNNLQTKIVETYAEDMARVIEDDREGLIKKIIHEAEEREINKKNFSPESRQNKIYMFISTFFVFAALATFLFFLLKRDLRTVPIDPEFTPIISGDKNSFLETGELGKAEIVKNLILKAKKSAVNPGGLEGIYLARGGSIVGLREFIALLEANLVLPEVAFVSDHFMMGSTNQAGVKTGENFFLLLKVRSFSDIFESLRSWENKILFNLHDLFGIEISSETNYLFTKDFENGFVDNKNARILYDKEGEEVLMYVFADDTSVIIASDSKVAREIILRLSGSKLKK